MALGPSRQQFCLQVERLKLQPGARVVPLTGLDLRLEALLAARWLGLIHKRLTDQQIAMTVQGTVLRSLDESVVVEARLGVGSGIQWAVHERGGAESVMDTWQEVANRLGAT